MLEYENTTSSEPEHDHQVDTTLWRAPDSCSYIIPDSPNIDINYVDLYNEAFSVDMTECNPVASCKFRDEVKTEEDKDELSICYSLFIPVPIENSGCVNIDITDMEQVYSLHSIDSEVYNTTTCESIISNNIGRVDLGNQDCSYFPFLNRPHEEHQQLLSVIDQSGFCLSITLLNLLDEISIPPILEKDELIDCFSVLIGLAFVSEKFEEHLEECICQTDNDEESGTQSRLSELEASPNKLTNSFDLDEDCFIIEQQEGIIEEQEDISDFIIDLITDEEEYVTEQPSSFILFEFLEIDDLNFEGRVPLGFYMPYTDSPNSGTIGNGNSQNVGQITIVVESNIGLVQYATLFHEAIHALDFQAHEWLQESYFTTTDSLRARFALIEGSATYFQRDYMLDQPEYAEDMLPPDRHIERFSENLAPLITKFTYSDGYNFVQQLMQKHDLNSVDQLFLNPPVSSEQILHPERYPEEVPLNVKPTEWQIENSSNTVSDRLGEFEILNILQHFMRFDEAMLAAEGWGSDSLQIVTDDIGFTSFTIDYIGDTVEDAKELETALQVVIDSFDEEDGKFMQVTRDGDRLLWVGTSDQDQVEELFALAP